MSILKTNEYHASTGFRITILVTVAFWAAVYAACVRAEPMTNAQAAKALSLEHVAQVLACKRDMPASDFQAVLADAGAHRIASGTVAGQDWAFSEEQLISGLPIQNVSIRSDEDANGTFDEFSARLKGVTFEEAATALGVPQGADGLYHKHVGSADLSVRAESGHAAMVCAYGVRSSLKSIKAAMRSSVVTTGFE